MLDPHAGNTGPNGTNAPADSRPRDASESSNAIPVDLNQAEVIVSLRCVECGYDVRGLKAGGQCPECGHAVLDTLQKSTDRSDAVPLMPDAPSIGNILFGLLVVATTATIVVSIGSVLDATSTWLGLSPTWPRVAMIAGGLVATLGIIGATNLELRKKTGMTAALRTSSTRFFIGYCIWSIALLATGFFTTMTFLGQSVLGREAKFMLLVSCAGGVLAMSGLGPLMAMLGARSREFSASRHSRQGAGGMMAALALMVIGVSLTGFDKQETFGWVLVRITQLMLLIGLIYLTVNAWWIHRALNQLPLTLRQMLRVVD